MTAATRDAAPRSTTIATPPLSGDPFTLDATRGNHREVENNYAVLNYDQWAGYPKDRQRVLQHLADAAVKSAIVLSGDTHLAGVAVLRAGEPGVGQAVAIEFVDVEVAHRGYTLHTVTPSNWEAAYRAVADVTDATSTVSTYRTFVVDAGTTAVRVAV